MTRGRLSATQTVAQRLTAWARRADVSKQADVLRIEAEVAADAPMRSEMPAEEELAIAVARTRVALGSLLDTYVNDRDAIDSEQLMQALETLRDTRSVLFAMYQIVTPDAEPPT